VPRGIREARNVRGLDVDGHILSGAGRAGVVINPRRISQSDLYFFILDAPHLTA
jgi:hypothetical protein